MKQEVKNLTEKLMRDIGRNDRGLQEYLNESLSPESDNYIKSHATIINMRVHGKAPNTDLLEDILSVYPVSDRRFHFALMMLALKKPHVWGFEGLVWRLKSSRLYRGEQRSGR